MIKKILAIGVVAFTLSSCGGTDYDKAAEMLCDCMAEAEAVDLALGLDMSGANYAVCALEADVDINDEQLTKSIASKCPDLSETHAEYLEGL